ncbi:MAG: hypothetical protein SGI94_16285 [Saprospiraceae bacterium]|nr:hypothetical protein [Saprospiraceae bacterium]
MTTGKKTLGIWMDNSSAHLMEFANDTIETTVLDSKFTHQEKLDSLSKSEKGMHNKEQHAQAAYYKSLSETIRDYDQVLLFGPTNAKDELYNTFKDNPLFKEVAVFLLPADKMTENQEQAFVRDYFSKSK